jgi:pimeloyl-ACP methyl ester carboxylesterase
MCAIVLGPEYREIFDKTLPPGAFEQALADVDTLFQVELGALERWSFTAEDAKRIRQPVVSVVGAESPPMFWEIHALVRQWMPHAEELTIPRANHGFPHMNPSALADGLARFLHGQRL